MPATSDREPTAGAYDLMGMAMTGEDWGSDDAAALFSAILSVEDRGEAERFFRDLCTRRELEEMVQRWAVVRLLAAGFHYRAISEQTGASTATITRINQWLQHGTGGYGLVLERLGLGSGGDTDEGEQA